MSRAYKFRNPEGVYFVSFSIINWIDIFTRADFCDVIIDSLKHCQKNKGLVVHAWIIMTNHVHLIISTNINPLEDIMRDLKSFTSRTIKDELKNHPKESRKEWLLEAFEHAGMSDNQNNDWKLWQNHNHPIELTDNFMIDQKLNYLHNNPVKARYVRDAEHWIWSSAKDYAGEKGPIKIQFLD